MQLFCRSQQTNSLMAQGLMVSYQERRRRTEWAVALAGILMFWKEGEGVKGWAGCLRRESRIKMGQSVNSMILLRKLPPNYCLRHSLADSTQGGMVVQASSIIYVCSFSGDGYWTYGTISDSLAALPSGSGQGLPASTSRMEAIFLALSISLTSGIMLMEQRRELILLLSVLSYALKNYYGGISWTYTGSDDQISMTTWLRFFFCLTSMLPQGSSFLRFTPFSRNCLVFLAGVESFSGSWPGLIFFSEGYLFLFLVSYPSVVLTLFNTLILLGSSYPYPFFPLRSLMDSTLFISPFSFSIYFNSTFSISSSCLLIFLASPKAKAMSDSILQSNLRSRLVVRPPLQLGQDFRALDLMYFSMHSLQNLWEHLRQTGLEKIYRQMVQVRLSKSLEQVGREGMRRVASRLGKRERTVTASSQRMYQSQSSISYYNIRGRRRREDRKSIPVYRLAIVLLSICQGRIRKDYHIAQYLFLLDNADCSQSS